MFVGVTNGQFEFVSDSLFLYNNQDTLKQRVVLKEDSLLVLETTLNKRQLYKKLQVLL